MARCGVDLLRLDQLRPFDGRLFNLVWSWTPDQPRSGEGRCAIQRVSEGRPFGRWSVKDCDRSVSVACRRETDWKVSARAVPQDEAGERCEKKEAEHAVPRTGYETQLLRRAMERSEVGAVWLGYRKLDGEWTAQDSRG